MIPQPAPSTHDSEILKRIADQCSVSVHVRRGDYVSQRSAAAVHGVCSLQYYRSALAAISRTLHDPQFFVFSDDARWTREYLTFPGPATFVDHNGPATAFQDLLMMSRCKHHVLANSSFSWWGAWLNPSPDKSVVAPRHWFADGRETKDLTPAEWIRL